MPGFNLFQESGYTPLQREYDNTNKEATNQNLQMDVLTKAQALDEAKYSFGEKKANRATRDEQAAAELEKARNQGYRYEDDTNDRKMLDALGSASIAEQTGNQGMWGMAVKRIEDVSPEMAQVINSAPPEKRKQLLGILSQQATQSLELQRKGIEMGMKGAQDRQTVRAQGEQTMANTRLQNEGALERSGVTANTAREVANINATARQEVAELSQDAEYMLRQIEQDFGPEVASKMRMRYMESKIQKNAAAGRGGKSQADHDKLFNENVKKSTETVLQNMLSTYSGSGLGMASRLDEFDDYKKIPGVQQVYDYVRELHEVGAGQMAATATAQRYAYVGPDRGLIAMPLDANGRIKGGITANRLADIARSRGWSMRRVLEWHRQNLIEEGIIQDGEWEL